MLLRSSETDPAWEGENLLNETPNIMMLRKKRRLEGMRDHQSRNTNIRLMAPTRNKALARKQGRNLIRRL